MILIQNITENRLRHPSGPAQHNNFVTCIMCSVFWELCPIGTYYKVPWPILNKTDRRARAQTKTPLSTMHKDMNCEVNNRIKATWCCNIKYMLLIKIFPLEYLMMAQEALCSRKYWLGNTEVDYFLKQSYVTFVSYVLVICSREAKWSFKFWKNSKLLWPFNAR